MSSDRSDTVRTWGPVLLILAAAPIGFSLLRAVLPAIGGDAPPPADPAPVAAAPPPAAGSARCAECHAEQAAAWSPSQHAGAERLPGPDDPPTVRAVGPDGTERDWPIERVIGVFPLVQYLVPFTGGRLQVTQTARDVRDGSWFDVFADGRAPGEWGHWTGAAMTWNARCADCHTTGFDKGFDASTSTYRSVFAEAGVGCEACHGDLDAHAAGAPAPTRAPDADTCAWCHARRADLTGRFEPGERLLDHAAPSLVDRTATYWPDGQVRDEDFEYAAFAGSRMAGAGVTCTSCHDPHTGKTRAEGDALCLSCHAGRPGFADHDPHPDGVAPGCVGCHQPLTTYMQRDPRHDHGFRIPDPVLQERHGIPSACDRCHAEQGVAWQVAAARRWWGDGDGPRRERADAMARARAMDESSVPTLLSVLRDDPSAAWRGAAAAHLEPWLERDDVRTAVVAAMADPDPLARFAVTGAVSRAAPDPAVRAALSAALKDPVLAVRVQAARALRSELRPGDPRAADLSAYLEHNADDPTALYERGTWAYERGDAAAATADLTRARDLDPGSPATRDALALVLSVTGHPAEAAAELRVAVTLAPEDGELWYRLGLAEVGASDGEAGVRALEQATVLAPELVRAWYNLGLLRQQRGDPSGAVAALREAAARAPTDPEVGYGLASVLHQQGRAAEAEAEARRVLAIDPQNAAARSLLQALVP